MSDQQGSRFVKGNKQFFIGIGVLVAVVAALVLIPRLSGDTTEFWQTVGAFAVWAIMIIGYFLPTFIAGRRKHHQLPAIAAVNLLLGWTFLGWIVALIWALTAVQNPYQPQPMYLAQQPPPVQYQVGDVVNGHRWNGQTWDPVT